jgi:uncharacterized protein YndB with AHSA1/START domain
VFRGVKNDHVRFSDEFFVARRPEEVFDYMVDPANLARWQTSKTYVTPLNYGPPGEGYRVREGTKVGPREWDQVVEFTEFDRGRAFAVEVVDGPPSSGRWTFAPEGNGSRVTFTGEAKAPPLLGFALRRILERQFRGYHANLRRHLEGG